MNVNVQEILQMIQNVDFRLIQAAVLVLILLLFWRAFARISRLYKEVARLNDRLDRTRDDVRTMKKPLVETIAPAAAGPMAVAAEESAASEMEAEPVVPDESFSFSAESFEQLDTEERGEESPFDTFAEDSFTFEEEPGEVESQTTEEEEDSQDRLGEDLEQTSWSADSDRLELDDLLESAESESQALTEEEQDKDLFEPEEPEQGDTIGERSGFNDFSFEEPAHEEPEGEEEALEEAAADEFGAETFEAEVPPGEEPVAEEPPLEEPVAEEPFVKEPVAETAPAESLAEPVDREAPTEEEPVREELPEGPSAEPEPEEEGSEILALPADPARPGVNFARCLACNFKLAYPARLSGKGVRCPSCKAKHVLP